MAYDPKLLIALLCLVVGAVVVSLIVKYMRRARVSRVRWGGDFSGDDLSPSLPYPVAAAPTELRPGAKTIAIIHDFGNPEAPPTVRESLMVREAFEVVAQIRGVSADTPIDLILHTPGGSAFACEMIAGALKDRADTVAYVPYCAMSAGTILALSCEKVVMGKHACLGPIDNQFMGIPADAFQRLMKEKPIEHIEDFTALLTYIVDKEQKNARAQACALMNKAHFSVDNACMITDFLSSGDLPHSEQIGRARAQGLGINIVDEDCPDAVYELVERRLDLLGQMGGMGRPFAPSMQGDAKPPVKPD